MQARTWPTRLLLVLGIGNFVVVGSVMPWYRCLAVNVASHGSNEGNLS